MWSGCAGETSARGEWWVWGAGEKSSGLGGGVPTRGVGRETLLGRGEDGGGGGGPRGQRAAQLAGPAGGGGGGSAPLTQAASQCLWR